MLDRRAFLKAAAATALMAPSLEFLRHFLAQRGQPFIETVVANGRTAGSPTKLYLNNAFGNGEFRLMLETPNYEPPTFAMSYADFADEYLSDWDDVCDSLNADVVDEYGNPNPRDPRWIHGHQQVNEEWAFDQWWPNHLPDMHAFDFLSPLDLGLFRRSHEIGEGWIEFTDGVCPGNDSRFVEVDALGASLLQRRLIERHYDVQLIIADP